MNTICLGRTGRRVSRTGFGCIPIQRISFDESDHLLRRAHDAGITFFDTARNYTTSEERLGRALGPVRRHLFLATKSGANRRDTLLKELDTSLANLRTDHIDLYQLHNPETVPAPGDEIYDTLLEAKRQGKILHIGITSHSRERAEQAVNSGHYDVLQFPLSLLSTPEELALVERCRQRDVGLLAMKGLAGGLISHAETAFVYLRQFENVVPLWGIQFPWQLEEFLALERRPPALSTGLRERIEQYRRTLAGGFCRACGYCLPCPAGIPIPMAARMSLLMGRMVAESFATPEWREKMASIERCTQCGHCRRHCPYHLDTPALLKAEREKYLRHPLIAGEPRSQDSASGG